MKNKIEQFASVERDFPGLLIQAQQYLLFRVDMSDLTPESLTKGKPGVSPVSLLQLFLHCPASFLIGVQRGRAGSWAFRASKYIFMSTRQGGASSECSYTSRKVPSACTWPVPSREGLVGHLFSFLMVGRGRSAARCCLARITSLARVGQQEA